MRSAPSASWPPWPSGGKAPRKRPACASAKGPRGSRTAGMAAIIGVCRAPAGRRIATGASWRVAFPCSCAYSPGVRLVSRSAGAPSG